MTDRECDDVIFIVSRDRLNHVWHVLHFFFKLKLV